MQAEPAGKRAFDVVVSLVALIVLAPLLIVVALGVRIRLGGPVFFVQYRAGREGLPFKLIKFRTMKGEPFDADGNPVPDSERITRLGRILRSTSIDELPELWNVLRGDMSLVGPRPLLLIYLERYDPRQRRRHDVRPGLTGLAQVSGRNLTSWEDRFEIDLDYVARQSLVLDLRILARTVTSVVRREGVSAEGHATMPEFLGSHRSVGVVSQDRAA